VEDLRYAMRKLADHLRTVALASAGGVYVVITGNKTEEVSYYGAATIAVLVWLAVAGFALLVDIVVGEDRK